MSTEISFLSLGSNLGDRKRNLEKAIWLLEKESKIKICQKSVFLETKALIVIDQPDFINSILKIETIFSPRQLLECTQKIEKEVGRIFRYSKGPREIDIDILLYGKEKISTPDLIVPHPGLRDREFLKILLVQMGENWENIQSLLGYLEKESDF